MEVETIKTTSTTKVAEHKSLLSTMRRDVQSAIERDPAARSTLEILLAYPGLHALWGYRLAHWSWMHSLKLVGRLISQITRSITGLVQ